MENVIFEPIFSNDVDYLQSNLVVVKRNDNLIGFHVYANEEGGVTAHTIDVESVPDWADFTDLQNYTGVNYTGEETGLDLYNMISDVISYYGAHEFDNAPDLYSDDEIGVIAEDFESFDNQDFINLMF